MGPLQKLCDKCGTENLLIEWIDIDTFCENCNSKLIFSDNVIKFWKKKIEDGNRHFNFIEFLMGLEKKYYIVIPDEEISYKKFTVNDLLKIIEKQTDKVNYHSIGKDLKEYLKVIYGHETVNPNSILYWEND